MSALAYLAKSRPLLRPQSFKSISTFAHLRQEAQQLEDPSPDPSPPPLPPNPASGSPRYSENWRSSAAADDGALIPLGLGFLQQSQASRMQLHSQTLDARGLMNKFAEWMTTQNWEDMKQLFEVWVRSLDKNGKPNTPDVDLYNHYLRANFMIGVDVSELVELVEQMEGYGISPNSASYNLVLKAMARHRLVDTAVLLFERVLQKGKEQNETLVDQESYDLVICMLLSVNKIDPAVKYIDLALKSGYMLLPDAFRSFVQKCVSNRKLDTLVSIIEKCKKMDENKSLCPPWNQAIYLAEVAMQWNNSDLAYYALEFMVKWITRGQNSNPPDLYSANEGLVVSALATAGRTYSSRLLDGAWAILKFSLRGKKLPNPESYLGKIYAYANLGSLEKAFVTLLEFDKVYGNTDREDGEDLFSPFYSLKPLVMACSKDGFATLDKVYYQLENLSQANPPHKCVAALNCVILGCANIWDVDRAYQTFNAIDSAFGLTPDVHSYNALICSFGKQKKVPHLKLCTSGI
ncbi:pentatricopeptide repeat-containing protein [Striga asiatica]|uniref:Pentatricopeptide repeat-containing protein n=1 Tax=Striga asiatica TaxID=4170 RepID=A0A5A7Q673_STRAF|nr:pentatricopeptide repeat-containing protein [Striga asiatica]